MQYRVWPASGIAEDGASFEELSAADAACAALARDFALGATAKVHGATADYAVSTPAGGAPRHFRVTYAVSERFDSVERYPVDTSHFAQLRDLSAYHGAQATMAGYSGARTPEALLAELRQEREQTRREVAALRQENARLAAGGETALRDAVTEQLRSDLRDWKADILQKISDLEAQTLNVSIPRPAGK